jgi:hypothetical protein
VATAHELAATHLESPIGSGSGLHGHPLAFTTSLIPLWLRIGKCIRAHPLLWQRDLPVGTAYSIRESLQGALSDFVRSAGFSCIHLEALIREFVGLLAAYREEGILLFPEVFVFGSNECLAALAPGSYQITLGSPALQGESAEVILKNCATLAVHGWGVFVVKEEGALRYGLFRSMRHSLATAAEESMGWAPALRQQSRHWATVR